MKAKSYAKINLSLDVLNKREDNYHNIETIMQKVNIYDELEFIKTEGGFELLQNDNLNIKTEDNFIYKAWKLLCDYTEKDLGIKVILKKNLPLASGLAGGTGNGAVTLKALNHLYGLGISTESLMEISLKLGADFPYMIKGGTVIAEGIGEKIEELPDFEGVRVLIVNPGYEISTKEVYENLKLSEKHIKTSEIVKAMEYKSAEALKGLLYNKMEESVFLKHPDIGDIKLKMESYGAAALMSGSGASVFGLFDSDNDLEDCYNHFKNIYPMTYKTCTIGGNNEF